MEIQSLYQTRKILSTISKGYADRLADALASAGYAIEMVFDGRLYQINLIEW